MSGPGDPYARVDYRRLIAWERRIAREGPWLLAQLAAAPERSVLDLGCGTGEHVAFFAEHGVRAVGLDRSEAMITAAREHEAAGRGRFVLGDALEARERLGDEAPFGLALSLGNMLPHVGDDAALARLLGAAHDALLPGGRLLVQLLNYRRILERGERSLPIDVRPAPARAEEASTPSTPSAAHASHAPSPAQTGDDPRKEIVFLRLMRDAGGGRILFFPTTLELDPDADEPVRVVSTRRVDLRAWTDDDLAPRLAAAGFDDVAFHGDMTGGPLVPLESKDLVFVARRR